MIPETGLMKLNEGRGADRKKGIDMDMNDAKREDCCGGAC